MLMEPQYKKQHATLKSFFTNDKQRYTFYFDLSPNTPPHKIDIYLQARTVTEDALLFAIDQLNRVIRKDKIQLVQDVRLYKARLVGRNFKPKTDLPCLSLYQKICDLKIEQIAVQIPNKEKAIRQINQQIQINQEVTLIVESNSHSVQKEAKIIQPQLKVQNKQIPKVQVKQNLPKQQPIGYEYVQQIKGESKVDSVILIQKPIKKEVEQQIIAQTKFAQIRDVIEQIQVTNDQSDQLREPSQQSKIKRQEQSIITQEKELKDTTEQIVEEVKIQRIQEQPPSKVQQTSNVQESKQVSKLIQSLIQERKELQQLRKEISEQKKDIRQQRKDLREQRSQVRQMRKQIAQQRSRLQQQRKQLSALSVRLQQERKEWQQKLSKIRKI